MGAVFSFRHNVQLAHRTFLTKVLQDLSDGDTTVGMILDGTRDLNAKMMIGMMAVTNAPHSASAAGHVDSQGATESYARKRCERSKGSASAEPQGTVYTTTRPGGTPPRRTTQSGNA